MAGEWVKVEKATADKPEVMRMSRALNMDRDAVLGKLLRVWIWFDSNSVDGVVDGAVDADVDGLASHVGFAIAMRQVGWLGTSAVQDRSGAGLCLPNFERHNGESSKKRALKGQRQTRWRQSVDAAPSTTVDAPPSTTASTREEKRRSKTPLPPSGAFERFWEIWPPGERKEAKGKCAEVWTKGAFDSLAEVILSHIEAMKGSEGWRSGFVPAPLVYLKQKRWEGADLSAKPEKNVVNWS